MPAVMTLLFFGNLLWSVRHPSLLLVVYGELLGCSSLLALLLLPHDLTLTLRLSGQHLDHNGTEVMLVSLTLKKTSGLPL